MGNGAVLGLHDEYEAEDLAMSRTFIDDWQGENEENSTDEAGQKKEHAKGIRITGAAGNFSSNINSCFIETGLWYNQHMLYQSLYDKHYWLRYTMEGRWMVSDSERKDNNSLEGVCCCKGCGYIDPSCAKSWYVLSKQGVFRTQAEVKATSMTDDEIQHQIQHPTASKKCESQRPRDLLPNAIKKCESQRPRDLLPNAIRIRGATGLLAQKINGVYRCQKGQTGKNESEHTCGGKQVFYRVKIRASSKSATTLSYDSSGRWLVVQGTSLLAYCGLTGLSNPCDATRWHVANYAKSFLVQPHMKVVQADGKKRDKRRKHMTKKIARKCKSPLLHTPSSNNSLPNSATDVRSLLP